jgi:hypothetical protein
MAPTTQKVTLNWPEGLSADDRTEGTQELIRDFALHGYVVTAEPTKQGSTTFDFAVQPLVPNSAAVFQDVIHAVEKALQNFAKIEKANSFTQAPTLKVAGTEN